jgi:UDPglucose--hexose-1-phosphate uridylyltransferase
VPELREDPITGALVIVAPGRAKRPDTHRTDAPSRPVVAVPPTCPFCPGHEAQTPPEVYRTGDGAPGTPGWRVRVVPNLYPIVGGDVPGAHEVVVLSPAHDASFGELSDDTAAEVFVVLRDRAAHHLASGLVHAQPFVNYGKAAGASIEHPHAQLIALGFVPPAVARVSRRFAEENDDLVLRAMREARDGVHGVVLDGALAWCPRASQSPYEMLVAAPNAGARFDTAATDEIATVAQVARRAVAALARVLGDIPYNIVVHTAPADASPFHWYARITPRLAVPAGFEEGTGLAVNPLPPEHAAEALRQAVDAVA